MRLGEVLGLSFNFCLLGYIHTVCRDNSLTVLKSEIRSSAALHSAAYSVETQRSLQGCWESVTVGNVDRRSVYLMASCFVMFFCINLNGHDNIYLYNGHSHEHWRVTLGFMIKEVLSLTRN